uniref:Uncharacterized protein n=1 Tax=Anguilla anguilla TaxID=7936 RepID=A0A0E9XC66_ANGAN
MTVTIQFS